jgi:hypothetical protein
MYSWKNKINPCKIISLTFGDHARDNSIHCWKNWRVQEVISSNSCRYFYITINLLEIEEGKVEIDEIDLGFCFIHVLYRVLSYGYTNLMGDYRIGRKHSRVNKMTILRVKQVLVFSNLFTYYEQDMAKSMIFLDYYNIMYEGHYENGRV